MQYVYSRISGPNGCARSGSLENDHIDIVTAPLGPDHVSMDGFANKAELVHGLDEFFLRGRV